jgi:hypothetical protein
MFNFDFKGCFLRYANPSVTEQVPELVEGLSKCHEGFDLLTPLYSFPNLVRLKGLPNEHLPAILDGCAAGFCLA